MTSSLQRLRYRDPHDVEGRSWTSATSSQEMLKNSQQPPKAKEVRTLVVSEETWPCQHIDFGLPTSRIVIQ